MLKWTPTYQCSNFHLNLATAAFDAAVYPQAFAAAFDVVPIRGRGTVSRLMNCVGWLLGGGAAPVTIGLLATYLTLGKAIAAPAVVYLLAGILLAFPAIRLLPADLDRLVIDDHSSGAVD